jgi:hydroxyacylglutathione hydrolase
VDLEVVVTPGLGDNTYLLASGGEAALVDPQRDAERFLALAEARGLRVRHVVETHVHNDYVSGAHEVRAATGAEIWAPARGRYEFPHHPVAEGDEIPVGGLSLVAMETPGHTPEHLAYLVREEGGRPVAACTGGSLMVGSAGRTDLLGEDLTEELTRAQFRSLRRLSELPDDVLVLPTHGAGSFCGAGPPRGARTSTLGKERARNPALAAPDEETFVRRQLSGLLAYPRYYAHMAKVNRAGPPLLAELPPPRPLTPAEVAERMGRGAWAVDARWRVQFARGHIPGSLNVELDETFASYVGWVVPWGAPVLLVLPEPEEREALEEAVTQLRRIGYDRVEGYLAGGIEAWRAEGRPVATYAVAGLEELCRAWLSGRVGRVLDVRQRVEWDRGSIPGSVHVFVGDLPERLGEVPADREVWTICATGHRASLAASILDRARIPVRLVEGTGVEDFLAHCLPRPEPG